MTGEREHTPRQVPRWPLLLIALPAFVAIWSGWVGLGRLTGFGPVVLLPGIANEWVIDSAITLPIGVEAYAAFAMWVWLAPDDAHLSTAARRFACWSSVGALGLGMAGQVAYHLMAAAEMRVAPWQITAFVACLPVAVVGCAAALVHLKNHTNGSGSTESASVEPDEPVEVEEPAVEEIPAADPAKVDGRGLSRMWETAPPATPKPELVPAPQVTRPAARRYRSEFLANPPAKAVELAQQHGKVDLLHKLQEEFGPEIKEYHAKELRRRFGPNNGHRLVAS